MGLRQRIDLKIMPPEWLNEMATAHHYMHQAIHPKASPFGWAVLFDGQMCQPDGKPSGFIIFASVHFTKLKGEFGYPGLPTKWQVLLLSRLWLHDDLPKRSETCVIGKALKLVQRRWLEVHPPRFLNEPYHVLKIISYANTRLFEGTIYKAANFRDDGLTRSQKRHKNTRGSGQDGDLLRRYIRDLKRPNWQYGPIAQQLGLFEEVAP
jgi:hypothetical protein